MTCTDFGDNVPFGAKPPTSSETELPIMRYPAAPATNDTAVAMICTISQGPCCARARTTELGHEMSNKPVMCGG
jgi:hypothetical protein